MATLFNGFETYSVALSGVLHSANKVEPIKYASSPILTYPINPLDIITHLTYVCYYINL